MEVAADVLANCLGITPRRVQLLAKQGAVVKLRRGVYDLEKSVQSYITYKLESLEESQEQKSLDEIRADHERWKMRKTQIAVRLMKGRFTERRMWNGYGPSALRRCAPGFWGFPSRFLRKWRA